MLFIVNYVLDRALATSEEGEHYPFLVYLAPSTLFTPPLSSSDKGSEVRLILAMDATSWQVELAKAAERCQFQVQAKFHPKSICNTGLCCCHNIVFL
jgi:hypothetical protein